MSAEPAGWLRPAQLFVRGLGCSSAVRRAPAGASRSSGHELGLFFPDRYADAGAQRCHLAAAAHLAAHARFGVTRAPRAGLKPIQLVLISLLEDARVEALLMRECPGLPALWGPFHRALPTELATFPALCARLARALFDASYLDPHPLLLKARQNFWSGSLPASALRCRELGSWLGNDVGQLRLPFNAREYRVEPCYRDDHAWQWQLDESQPVSHEQAELLEAAAPRTGQGTPREGPGEQREPARVQPASASSTEATRVPYPEWDYRIERSRPAFSSVWEKPASEPRAALLEPAQPLALLARLDRAGRLLQGEQRRRSGRQQQGELLQLDAAIAARVDRLAGRAPDERVYVAHSRQRPRLAVLVLLDLSASTGDPVRGGDGTVLQLAQRACSLLARVLARAAVPFAIHGFSSNGRQQVDYLRIKELTEPWNDGARQRLLALTPGLSTRMGAALRHAGELLAPAQADHHLLLVVTDGEPSDIDAPDPRYLLHDARHAVQTLRQRKITSYAVSLDPAADPYVRTIFGVGRYLVLNCLQRLPELLPRVFMQLAR